MCSFPFVSLTNSIAWRAASAAAGEPSAPTTTVSNTRHLLLERERPRQALSGDPVARFLRICLRGNSSRGSVQDL